MLDLELYPFQGHTIAVKEGVNLHYLDEGPKDAPVLVMVHGNPTWSFYYRNMVLGLRENMRCIVPDHVGCGLSDKPQDYPYTLSQHIDNLELLLTELKVEKLTLMVHDWGGAIGMGVASRHPEWIERLVILNTAAFFMPIIPFRIAICRWPLLGPFLNRALNGFARAAIHMAVTKKNLSPIVAQGFLHPYNNWANCVAIDRFVLDIPMEKGHPTRETLDSIEASLEKFKSIPTQIHWGMKDFCFTPAFLERWKQHLPEAKIFEYHDCGHYILEDAEEDVLQQLQSFLGLSTHV